MIHKKKLLAIIPARSGSKRLPEKNILNFLGKPLVAWTIKAAINSKYIDRVVVSTDSDKIANISKTYGADVPVIRPSILATDNSKSTDVVIHLLDELESSGHYYDYVILLQPTSPLRQTIDINNAIQQLIRTKSNAIISVCEVDHHPLWCNTLPKDKSMDNFIDLDIKNKRSQDLPINYRLNGAIYMCNVKSLRKNKNFFLEKKCGAYIMDKNISIDIDCQNDFDLASIRMRNLIV